MSLKKSKTSSSRFNLQTSVSLSKTKPARIQKIARIQKKLEKAALNRPAQKALTQDSNKKVQRQQPKSQLEKLQKIMRWFVPARISFVFMGLSILIFGLISYIGVLGSFKIIKPLLALPFEPTFASLVLLEIAAALSLLVAALLFYAAIKPHKYYFLYYFLLVFFLPLGLISDYSKLQLEIPQLFQSYISYDMIAISIFWTLLLISLPAYLNYKKQLRKIKLQSK